MVRLTPLIIFGRLYSMRQDGAQYNSGTEDTKLLFTWSLLPMELRTFTPTQIMKRVMNLLRKLSNLIRSLSMLG